MGGTTDGLAPAPYVRESRRIKAEFTVLEQHVADPLRPTGRAIRRFRGHRLLPDRPAPQVSGAAYIDIGCSPFQIPLGALIPARVENLLPAGKNLGMTHITNGCYRLHPVEWDIGEAAGISRHSAWKRRPRRDRCETVRAFSRSSRTC